METAIFAYSTGGRDLAVKLAEEFFRENIRLYTMKRICKDAFMPLEEQGPDLYGREFRRCSLLIFIGAAGIAVRKIAPYVKDKKTDPAVICMDEKGTFVIPLLSGHIGGANAAARKIARFLESTPVITTATDVCGRFAVDEWAANCGFAISDMKTAKRIAAEILEKDIPVCCDFPVKGGWPQGIFPVASGAGLSGHSPSVPEKYDTGIYIGCRNINPFRNTLKIIPPVIRLGIGCRKGIGKDCISAAAGKILAENGLDERAVNGIYSIDLKAREPGLLEFAGEKGWPLTTYTADELKKVKGDFSSSQFVESITGVDNVCERAAAMGGEIIAGKMPLNGVTAALAKQPVIISFESAIQR